MNPLNHSNHMNHVKSHDMCVKSHTNHRSLLQKSPESFEGLFCKRDLWFSHESHDSSDSMDSSDSNYLNYLNYMNYLNHKHADTGSLACVYIVNVWAMNESCVIVNVIHTFVSHLRVTTDCSTLQHTATHCNTLQHTATNCNTPQYTATHCNTLQHTATHCNTQQTTSHLRVTHVNASFRNCYMFLEACFI